MYIVSIGQTLSNLDNQELSKSDPSDERVYLFLYTFTIIKANFSQHFEEDFKTCPEED